MSDPEPWRDDAAAPPEVRDLLARAGRAGPSPEERAALARRLAPMMAPPAPSVRGWIAGGVAIAVCIAVIAWLAWPREPIAIEHAAPPPDAAPLLGAAPATQVEATAPIAPIAEPAPMREPVARRPRSREPDAPVPASDVEAAPAIDRAIGAEHAQPEATPSELALLREARASLRGDPEHALEVLALHAHHHPRGVFTEEREALAVEALVRAGRTAEARRRADALFVERPSTAHRAHLEELLAR